MKQINYKINKHHDLKQVLTKFETNLPNGRLRIAVQ